ncbi:MAG TPA: elongation factor P [Candidatus Acetothermia bacterium]|nr:elongation factor P [Candidatus Acetothermia bacterium]
MGLSVSELRRGMSLLYEGELYEVVEYEHSKRGRAGAVAKTKLKHLKSGRVLSATFKGSEDTEAAFLESRELQYLYHDGDNLVFMDNERFDQFPLGEDVLGPQAQFLVEGNNVIGLYYRDELVKVDVPNFVELKVVKTEPGVKGDTVSNVEKPATVETGAVVQVPLFVKEGDTLKIDTRTGTYVERL